MISATPEQADLLYAYIIQALQEQDDPAVARAAARQLDAGEWRMVSEFRYESSATTTPGRWTSTPADIEWSCTPGATSGYR